MDLYVSDTLDFKRGYRDLKLTYPGVGAMKDYVLKQMDLRVSHTLGCAGKTDRSTRLEYTKKIRM